MVFYIELNDYYFFIIEVIVLYIGTASYDNPDMKEKQTQALKDFGMRIWSLDVATKDASDEEFILGVKKCFFGQAKVAKLMKNCICILFVKQKLQKDIFSHPRKSPPNFRTLMSFCSPRATVCLHMTAGPS